MMVGYSTAHEKSRLNSKVYNTDTELLATGVSTGTERVATQWTTIMLKEIGNDPCHWYL